MKRWDDDSYDERMRSARALGFAILWTVGVAVGVLSVLFFLMARA